MRLLVDTNVFIDLLYRSEENTFVGLFFQKVFDLKDEIYVSAMSLRDIEYFAHKMSHNKQLAKEAVMSIYQFATKIVDTSADSAITTLYSDDRDFEDSMQIECAEDNMCDAIVTMNIKDFKNSPLPVLSVKDYIAFRKK